MFFTIRGLVLISVLSVSAQAASFDLGGVGDLIGDKMKETKLASLIDLNAKFAGAVYLPIWLFHDQAGVNYVETGVGGMLKEGGESSPLISLAVNGPAISGRIWSSEWAKKHVTRTKFPDIWMGPYLRLPLPGRTWVIGENVGGMVSVRLGKGE